jgi:hypothetical protein
MGAVTSFVFMMLDSVLVLAGHGDSITGNAVPTKDPGAEDESGIGMVPIVGVVLIVAIAVALMIWLNRQDKDAEVADASGAGTLRMKSVAPLALIAVVIATPLIVWTASSGGDEKNLKVERWTSVAGEPELLISLIEQELNTPETTDGKKVVRLECRGRDGQPVLTADQKWPFIKEKGYDYPHAHQAATPEQVQRADSCRLQGTSVSLEADVKGALAG